MRMCSSPRCPPPIDAFTDLPLNPEIVQHFRQTDPLLPFQRRMIPIIFAGLSMLYIDEHRSGLCAAYMIPALSRVVPPLARTEDVRPSLVILAPTRELALGLSFEVKRYTANTRVRSCVVFGGAPMDEQIKQLSYGCDVLVGTPGRLLDLVTRRAITLESVRCFVMEEASRTLDMGFGDQVRALLSNTPRAAQTVVLASVLTTQLDEFLSDSVPAADFLLLSLRPLIDKLV